MKTPIYLDYAATTPVDPKVAEKMMACMTIDGTFGNPASRSHIFGWEAEEAVEQAREQVAIAIGADSREIVWTSGATEANNLAIKGVALANQSKGMHIVTSSIEHKAVLDPCAKLEQQGFEVTYLAPTPEGTISPESVEKVLRDDTTVVSIMHVNNELGTVNDIASIGALCRARGIALHVDAAQSLGKVPIDVKAMNIDLLSISAHKFYGPKGVGALYVRRRPPLQLEAQIHGGGHERGMRSGTLATHQIVGLGEACRIANEDRQNNFDRVTEFRKQFIGGIADIEQVQLNGHPDDQYPGIVNLSFAYVEGESLIMALKDMAISSGSACTSASMESSHVLRGIGVSDRLAHSSIRFSFGRYTTPEDIAAAVANIKVAVDRLRQLSPQWKKFTQSVIS